MMNNLKKLTFWLIAISCFISCSFRDTKHITIENNQLTDSLKNQCAPLHIDTIDTNQLINSKWAQIVAENCITYITFNKSGTYKEDNCEWDLTFEGKYKTSKDTIFLIEYDLASQLPGEKRIVNTAIYTYIYQKDSLLFVRNQQVEKGKIVKTYYPNTPVYFKRER